MPPALTWQSVGDALGDSLRAAHLVHAHLHGAVKQLLVMEQG